MSAHKPRYSLTPGAQRDLRDILIFTDRQWGTAQRRVYRKQLDAAFVQLARYPDLGILRPEFGPGIRGYRVRQHVVIYQPSTTEVLIVRILHVRRDSDAEFD